MVLINQWISKGNYRAVKISWHTSGIRVSLEEDFKEVTWGIGCTIEYAFNEALKMYPVARENKLKQEVETYKRMIDDSENELASRKTILKKLQNSLKGKN